MKMIKICDGSLKKVEGERKNVWGHDRTWGKAAGERNQAW